ncbi:unnamed protein product [Caenorhabditis bovis]|uniref:Uncharacterized protein n=1 Tax=Caenorhabditis bovis TaxID=2654633 RepID=A0A8S1FDU3_9PELO|nr:unnamed protein product [Caenorhabditis bovis]
MRTNATTSHSHHVCSYTKRNETSTAVQLFEQQQQPTLAHPRFRQLFPDTSLLRQSKLASKRARRQRHPRSVSVKTSRQVKSFEIAYRLLTSNRTRNRENSEFGKHDVGFKNGFKGIN